MPEYPSLLVWIKSTQYGMIKKRSKGYEASMYRRIVTILCSFSCIILLMPQGWCCWLAPLECCKVVATKSCCQQHTAPKEKEASCCSHQSTPQEPEQPAAPLPVMCAKCIHDTTKQETTTSFDQTLELVALLPVVFQSFLPVRLLPAPAHLHGDSPLLHVQICVWRC